MVRASPGHRPKSFTGIGRGSRTYRFSLVKYTPYTRGFDVSCSSTRLDTIHTHMNTCIAVDEGEPSTVGPDAAASENASYASLVETVQYVCSQAVFSRKAR